MTIKTNTNYSLDANSLTYLGERDYLLKVAENNGPQTKGVSIAIKFSQRLKPMLVTIYSTKWKRQMMWYSWCGGADEEYSWI